MATKRVTVVVDGIKALHAVGGEPGADLEVYGNLGAWVKRAGSEIGTPPLQSHEFWNVGNPHSVTVNATLHVGGTVTFDVDDNEDLWFGGHIWEDDLTSGNDDMGGHYERFPFSTIPGQLVEVPITFRDSGGGQQAEVIFKVTSHTV